MTTPFILHASTVAHAGRAVAIVGPSGSGKSGLALQLMAFGATLVADDRTILTATDTGLIASCPPPLDGLIEARGLGLLHAPMAGPTPLGCVVDMAQHEAARLPPLREVTYIGRTVPLFWACNSPHFAAAVFHMLAHGRRSDD